MDWQNRIEGKIDKISDKIETINLTVAKQEENLQEHMRRTEIAEKSIELLHEEIRPLKEYSDKARAAVSMIIALSSIVLFFLSVAQFFK